MPKTLKLRSLIGKIIVSRTRSCCPQCTSNSDTPCNGCNGGGCNCT